MASTSDASLYVREDVTGLSILLVYVDDILIACKKGQLEGIMGMFANEFDILGLGARKVLPGDGDYQG
jgi:hypothetical protein